MYACDEWQQLGITMYTTQETAVASIDCHAQAESTSTPRMVPNGPSSPFQDVKIQDEEHWWGNSEHLQRMQEQEKQRAAQLQHTRAWAEAQVPLVTQMPLACQAFSHQGT